MERLAICAIFKNEAPYLLEWIDYHRMVGFDHFVLYDNASTDDGVARIQASPLSRNVEIIPWPPRPGQLIAYRDFIQNHARRFDWVAFIDIDEFIVPLETASVRDLLIRYGGFSAVLINWLIFGPSGHDRRPEGLVLDNYRDRVPEDWNGNRHVKTLARVADLIDIGINAHAFKLRQSPCNPLSQPAPNVAIQPYPCHERLVINHYLTRSREDWEIKLRKGPASTPDREQPRYPYGTFDRIARHATMQDDRARLLSARLRGTVTAV